LSLVALLYYVVLGFFLGIIHVNNIGEKRAYDVFLLLIIFPIFSVLLALINIDIREAGFFEEKFAEPIVYKMYLGELWYDSFVPYYYLNKVAYESGSVGVYVPTAINLLIVVPLMYGYLKGNKNIVILLLTVLFTYYAMFSLRDILIAFALTTFCMSIIRYNKQDEAIEKAFKVLLILVSFLILVYSRSELVVVFGIALILYSAQYQINYIKIALLVIIIIFLYPYLYDMSLNALGMSSGGDIGDFIVNRYERHSYDEEGGGSHILGGELLRYHFLLRLIIQTYATLFGAIPFDFNINNGVYTFYSIFLLWLFYRLFGTKKQSKREYFVVMCLVAILFANIPFASNYGNLLRMKIVLLPALLYVLSFLEKRN